MPVRLGPFYVAKPIRSIQDFRVSEFRKSLGSVLTFDTFQGAKAHHVEIVRTDPISFIPEPRRKGA